MGFAEAAQALMASLIERFAPRKRPCRECASFERDRWCTRFPKHEMVSAESEGCWSSVKKVSP